MRLLYRSDLHGPEALGGPRRSKRRKRVRHVSALKNDVTRLPHSRSTNQNHRIQILPSPARPPRILCHPCRILCRCQPLSQHPRGLGVPDPRSLFRTVNRYPTRRFRCRQFPPPAAVSCPYTAVPVPAALYFSPPVVALMPAALHCSIFPHTSPSYIYEPTAFAPSQSLSCCPLNVHTAAYVWSTSTRRRHF